MNKRGEAINGSGAPGSYPSTGVELVDPGIRFPSVNVRSPREALLSVLRGRFGFCLTKCL
jgi:hypothetical protein